MRSAEDGGAFSTQVYVQQALHGYEAFANTQSISFQAFFYEIIAVQVSSLLLPSGTGLKQSQLPHIME